jgi:pterin-4a-carbinolamine dehydratase/quercetin dioxygenase-like cupin family protein
MSQPSRPVRLTADETASLAASLPHWQVSADGKAISRRFRFPDFESTVEFFNRVASLAAAQDHHPDAKVGYDYCELAYTTHDQGGLTLLDAVSARTAQAFAEDMCKPKEAAHYAWKDVPEEMVNASMWRRIVTGERLMVAKMRFKDGFVVPQHHHVHEQVTQVTSGRLRFWLGADRSQVVDVGPGEILVIPPNLPHEVLCIGDVEENDIWTPRREDWLNGTDAYLRG